MSSRLRVFNSLKRDYENFIPHDPNEKQVNWYSCGPTVYDASHMGHARSYISFDILRRVLSHYFGYNVQYVMNVTDIDDKIIKRARQEYLLSKYSEKANDLSKVINDTLIAKSEYVTETFATTDPDKKTMRERVLTKVAETIAEFEAQSKENPHQSNTTSLINGVKEILYDFLDKRFLLKENHELENEVFGRFARKWEEDFFADMNALNVLDPDVLTRVSEYVPEIVAFIERIISNGYGYESNGSVYFDVANFKNSPNHTYAKLIPEATNDEKALAEGEGELSVNRPGEKKSAVDFALWKASRPGEPSWDSPWGKGRPGWHIECSAMASAIFGPRMDIHTGGVDLKFPHHDNELAQSEAYFENDDWVKYFLHSGHLTIAGCKMSKSLKNFITIKQALEDYTAAQLRITFLLHSWKDTLDYSPNGMQMAVQLEKTIQEFFLNVKDSIRGCNLTPKWTQADLNFQLEIEGCKNAVHMALCDNIDTRTAMFAIKELVGLSNLYLQGFKVQSHPLNGPLLKSAAKYITRMLTIFGVIPSSELEAIGFKTDSGDGSIQKEDILIPYLEVLADFREKVRSQTRLLYNTETKQTLLTECDLIRDEKLPLLGVRLEDHKDCPTVVKYVGVETMMREREQKERLEREKEAEKQRKREEMAKAQAEREAQMKIPPWDLFRKSEDAEKYSAFDVKGLPTHDKEGNSLPKSTIKKNLKLFTAQEKKYNDYLKTICGEDEKPPVAS